MAEIYSLQKSPISVLFSSIPAKKEFRQILLFIAHDKAPITIKKILIAKTC